MSKVRKALGDVTNAAGAGAGGKAKKASAKKASASSIEETYKMLSQVDHILVRPDSYIGSTEHLDGPKYVFDSATKKIVERNISFVPGLYKIFDEILVNAADNKQRDPTMDSLKVVIDKDEGLISVRNNGAPVPVVEHAEHKMYVPELVFGHLLTGSNYDDDQKKVTGGRNGYGAKLTNIFSTEFTVEVNDVANGKRFKQTWRNNMKEKDEPRITSPKGSDSFTSVTFKPDLARFKMTHLDDDIVALMTKRVYDIAGTTDKSLKVSLNSDKPLKVNGFQKYVGLYFPDKAAAAGAGAGAGDMSDEDAPAVAPQLYKTINDRWEICVSLSEGQFTQVSFVNAICTTKGGQHVNYIADQITKAVTAKANKKNKGVEIKPFHVKNHLSVFVNCLIENPAFDSQSKDTLTTRPKSFGSTADIGTAFMNQVLKCGLIDRVQSWAKFKQTAELKKTGGSKKVKMLGIPKLDDANCAGGAKADKCTLILTEGDSAKTLAVAGLSIVGRDYYGVFPLKGKLLNVREAAHKTIVGNAEISNIVKIMGLKYGTTYTSTKGLRYGHIMIMADQDHDGSHIKGLVINFLHHFWPSLLKLKGFVREFITPIVRCTKGKSIQSFFTIPQYLEWRDETDGGKGWNIKYYKGLGTSTSVEAKTYFKDLDRHMIDFGHEGKKTDDVIDLAFSKKRADDRKAWLLALEAGTYVDYAVKEMAYSDFVNKELILFSQADVMRSIPSAIDGFKPAQRKVLFACFKRKLKREIKVAQLAGYVSEHTAYHHGEVSLQTTIVGMAQDYVGSNNINLLQPSGMFGTRLMGGKDVASARYIFTRLNTITRKIFRPEDDAVLAYQNEDGDDVEPVHFVPILPMILINGADGIGTGWSSFIPCYNPRDVIGYLKAKLLGEDTKPLYPWYRGFSGSIVVKDAKHFATRGSYEYDAARETLHVSELPIRKWTQDYKTAMEALMVEPVKAKKKTAKGKKAAEAEEEKEQPAATISTIRDRSTDTLVDFTMKLTAPGTEYTTTEKVLRKHYKLEASFSTTNMHAFDETGKIFKYDTAEHIADEFITIRREFYHKRKAHMIAQLTKEYEKLDNQMRFISMVIEGELVVSKKKKSVLMKELQALKFKPFPKKLSKKKDDDDSDDEEEETKSDSVSDGYNYLLSMALWSLTLEKVEKLRAQRDAKEAAVDELRSTTIEQMWLRDLQELEDALDDRDEKVAKKKVKAKDVRPAASVAFATPPPVKKVRAKKSDLSTESKTEDTSMEAKPKKAAAKKTTAASTKKTATKKKAAPAAKRARSPPPSPDSPDAEPLSPIEVQPRVRAPRRAAASATTKNTYVIDDSEDEFSDEEESDTFSVGSEEESDYFATPAPVKPKSKTKAAAVSKPKPAAKATTKKAATKKPAAAKPKRSTASSKAKTVVKLSDDEEEELDDSFDMIDTPSPVKPKATKATKAKAKATKSKASKSTKVLEEDDDLSDEEYGSFMMKPLSSRLGSAASAPVDSSEEEEAPVVKTTKKKTTTARKTAAPKRAAKVVEESEEESEFDDSDFDLSPAPAPKPTARAKAAAKKVTAAKPKAKAKAKPAPKPKAAVKKAAPKKKAVRKVVEESESEEEEQVIKTPKPTRRAASRASKKTSYAELSDSEEEDFDFDDDEDDFSEDDDGDDSDF